MLYKQERTYSSRKPGGELHYPLHSTQREGEAQKGQVICPRLSASKAQGPPRPGSDCLRIGGHFPAFPGGQLGVGPLLCLTRGNSQLSKCWFDRQSPLLD